MPVAGVLVVCNLAELIVSSWRYIYIYIEIMTHLSRKMHMYMYTELPTYNFRTLPGLCRSPANLWVDSKPQKSCGDT